MNIVQGVLLLCMVAAVAQSCSLSGTYTDSTGGSAEFCNGKATITATDAAPCSSITLSGSYTDTGATICLQSDFKATCQGNNPGCDLICQGINGAGKPDCMAYTLSGDCKTLTVNGKTLTSSNSSCSGGGFPWWGYVLIVLGVLALLACVVAGGVVVFIIYRKRSQASYSNM